MKHTEVSVKYRSALQPSCRVGCAAKGVSMPVKRQRQHYRDEQPRLATGGAGSKRAKAVH